MSNLVADVVHDNVSGCDAIATLVTQSSDQSRAQIGR